MASQIEELKNRIATGMLDFIADDDASYSDDAPYSREQVNECITLLENFVNSIGQQTNNIEFALGKVKELVLALNQLNEQCDFTLIETEQREDIYELIVMTLAESGYKFDGDITEEWREW